MKRSSTEGIEPPNLAEWIRSIGVGYTLLGDLLDGLVLDHSPESLFTLEKALAGNNWSEVDPRLPDAVAAYIGQTLRCIGGGRWIWDENTNTAAGGRPVVIADDELDLPMVSPVDLVARTAVSSLSRVCTAWVSAVAEHIESHPGWQPTMHVVPGLDPIPATAVDSVNLESWLDRQQQLFPNWVATYGGDHIWDFSSDTIYPLAMSIFHTTPTLEQFEAPANTMFADGATWYYGEVLRRHASSHWMYDPTIESYAVAIDSEDWTVSPGLMLSVMLDQGHPFGLHDMITSVVTPWAADERSPMHWRWTGRTWHSDLDRWTHSIAALIDSLGHLLPVEHTMDFSVESLTSLEELIHTAEDDTAFADAVAAYLGEALLRVGGGYWKWNDDPSSGSLGMPIVTPFEPANDVSPHQLVQLARRWRDGNTFTRVYNAWERAAHELHIRRPFQHPAKIPTPGLDPTPPSAIQTWCDTREHEFPHWAAQHGRDRTWDFSMTSLDDLATIIFATTPTPQLLTDPRHEAFATGAVWYFGETIRRAAPAHWEHEVRQPDPGWSASELWNVSIRKLETGNRLLSTEPFRDMHQMLLRGDRAALSDAYRHWVAAPR